MGSKNQLWRQDMRSDSFMTAASLGLVPGVRVFEKAGYNVDIPAAGKEDLITQGGTYVFPDNAGESLEIVSDNAADVGQDVRITLLDANFDEEVVTVVTNGTTPVAIPGTFTRVNAAIIISAVVRVGTVSIRRAGGGPLYGEIQPLDGIMFQAVFTVPAGLTGVITRVQGTFNKSGGAAANAVIRFRNVSFGTQPVLGSRFGLTREGDSESTVNVEQTTIIPEKFDLVVQAECDTNGSDVTAAFTIVCFDNELISGA